MRPVERGLATTDLIAVTKGLALGERVVTEGGDRLRDGARVQLAERSAGLGGVGCGSGRRSAGGAASGASGAQRQRRQRPGDGG